MSVITLTTDMGIGSFYVASVKGVILQQAPDVRIIDISHEITPFDLNQTAFVLRNSWQSFPKGTIHLIGVDSAITQYQQHVLVIHRKHFFLGADNGVFSLLFDEEPDTVLRITDPSPVQVAQTFAMKNVFAPVAAKLAANVSWEMFTEATQIKNRKIGLKPVVEESLIRGTVVYVDHYNNAITNISRDLFDTVGKGRRFAIRFRRTEVIRKISDTYNEVVAGERLCLFGVTGYLEVAMNQGEAEKLLGLRLGMQITIEFT